MWHPMRPGNRIRFWFPRSTHRAEVEAPGLLRFVAALDLLVVVGPIVAVIVAWLGTGAAR